MERRKPPEDKRRAIERLLSRDGGDATMIRRKGDDETKVRKVRQRSFELGDDNPFEVQEPDDAIKHAHINLDDDSPVEIVDDEPESDGFVPAKVEADEPDDDDMSAIPAMMRRSSGGGARNAIIIAAVILFIGAGASALILAREQIMALFGGSSRPVSDEAAAARITELEQENADLKEALQAGGGEMSVEISNLRRANASLQETLDDERNRAENLQQQLNTFKTAGPDDNPALKNAQAEVSRLTGELSSARETISQLQQQVEDSSERMLSYTRENSRLNSELETAKQDSRDASGLRRENERLTARIGTLSRDLDSANSQITVLQNRLSESKDASDVNDEYRRVLDLLKQSREANNNKQDRIDELLTENGKLREQVSTLQRQTTPANTRQASSNTTNTTNNATSSGVTQDPRPIDIVRPSYPASALRRKVEGTVELNVLVSEKGIVLDAKVVRSPDPLRTLDRAALSAVRKWKFSPAMRNGTPIRMWHKVPMEFTLSREEE